MPLISSTERSSGFAPLVNCGMNAPPPNVGLIESVRMQLRGVDRVVLAVSGGLDSMALLDLVARTRGDCSITVATFDHGTGEHAERAVELVASVAGESGLSVAIGRAETSGTTEAAWRAARWEFLRRVSRAGGGDVMTAHTQDDQLETVVMRVLRGSGARGIAGLYAASPGIRRPLVTHTRAEIEEYARSRGLRWLDDPSNLSRRHLRNRVRLDLLPAFHAVDPQFPRDFLALASRAGEVRRAIDSCVAEWTRVRPIGSVAGGGGGRAIEVGDDVLSLEASDARAYAWGAMLGAHGVVADRRGLARLGAVSHAPRTGWYIELSAGWIVARVHQGFLVLPASPSVPQTLDLDVSTAFGRFRFERRPGRVLTDASVEDSPWTFRFPAGARLQVRSWDAGDRVSAGAGGSRRRVKRFFPEVGIPRIERTGWPVVVYNGEIVWVPGICRSVAPTGRPGKPEHLYTCTRAES